MTESDRPAARSWLRRLLAALSDGSRAASGPGRGARRSRLATVRVERLEDRCQPAALVVGGDDFSSAAGDRLSIGGWLSFDDPSFGDAPSFVAIDSPAALKSRWPTGDGGLGGGSFFAEEGWATAGDAPNGIGLEFTDSLTGPEPGGYVDPSDTLPHEDSPYMGGGGGASSTMEGGDRGAFTPAIAPDTRFKGGRDVLPAQSGGLPFGGGFTLGFAGDPNEAVPVQDELETAPSDDSSSDPAADPIAADDDPKATKSTAPLRAAAGVSQTFELSGAPTDAAVAVEGEWEADPLDAPALSAAAFDVPETEPAALGDVPAEPTAEPDAEESADGLVWVKAAPTDRDLAALDDATAESFWAALGQDDDASAAAADPATTGCFFERNECLIGKTSSAVAVAAIVGLLHRGWKKRRLRNEATV